MPLFELEQADHTGANARLLFLFIGLGTTEVVPIRDGSRCR
jgi:hypothetical protein